MSSATISVLDVVRSSRSRCEIPPRWLEGAVRHGAECYLTVNRALDELRSVGAQQNPPLVNDRWGRGWVQWCLPFHGAEYLSLDGEKQPGNLKS
jgi:hypothetical protein